MGFIILAKGKQNLFLMSDVAWTLVYLGLASVCVRSFGVNGAGIAFFGSYVFHVFITYPIVRHLSGFRCSSETKKTGLVFLSLIAVVFCGFYCLPHIWANCLGGLALILSGTYVIRVLLTLVDFERTPRVLQVLLASLHSFSPVFTRMKGCFALLRKTNCRTEEKALSQKPCPKRS
jgi:PST family polysaccharide transporter